MSNTVTYVGEDALIGLRLSELAKGGQTLMSERHCHDILSKINPLPLLFQVTVPQSATENTDHMNLCVIQNRMYVGRFFVHRKIADTKDARSTAEYRQLRDEIYREDLRWAKRATLVMPKKDTAAANSDALLTGESSSSLEFRRRDLATAQYLASHFGRRVAVNGTADPIILQMEALEHNMMLLEDRFYDGKSAELYPLLLDLVDFRGLISEAEPSVTERFDVGLERDAEAAEDAERLLEEELARNRGPRGKGSKLKDIEKKHQAAYASLEEELQDVREKYEETTLDVLALHRDLRFFLNLLRQWFDPILDPNKFTLTEEDFVLRVLQQHRATVEEVRSRSMPPRKPQEEWRELLSVSLEREGEEAFATEPFKLCRSMLAHVGKHFVYLRGFARRLKVKEGRHA